jgi:hypothetical protein
LHRRVLYHLFRSRLEVSEFFRIFRPIYNFMPMSTKQKFLVVVLILVAIVSACSITIQVQKNNTNSTQENSQETNQSADSARVNFHLNP